MSRGFFVHADILKHICAVVNRQRARGRPRVLIRVGVIGVVQGDAERVELRLDAAGGNVVFSYHRLFACSHQRIDLGHIELLMSVLFHLLKP